jgi:hypothetical protein
MAGASEHAVLEDREFVMNLNILPINVMLSHSEQWLSNPELRVKIEAHLVGIALLVEVGRVHDRLAGQVERRRQLDIALTRLTDLITDFDVDHDDLARAIHFALEALISASRDAARLEGYRRLQSLLFPEGLSIVSRSYSYEAGAITALQSRVTEADVAELAGIPVGDATLADWYRSWIGSGQSLGRHVHEREGLYARAGRGGSATANVDIRTARLDWVNTVQTFVVALHLMNLDQETRERILSPLDASIAQALRSRAGDEVPEETPGDELPGDELPGGEPGLELPGGQLPGGVPSTGPAPGAPAVTVS